MFRKDNEVSLPILEELRQKIGDLVKGNGLSGTTVRVRLGTLTTQQAIGEPERKDYPLLEGKEVMIEAELNGHSGQAFTDTPHDFTGTLDDILTMDLDTNRARAVLIASANAVVASLGLVDRVRHCRDEEPETCALELAGKLKDEFGQVRIGMIGLQPAILDHLVRVFGGDDVVCTDLARKNIGTVKYGAKIWDGHTRTEELITRSDIILATSSTIVNNTFDHISQITREQNKELIIFGVTGAAAAFLCDVRRMCFQPH